MMPCPALGPDTRGSGTGTGGGKDGHHRQQEPTSRAHAPNGAMYAVDAPRSYSYGGA